MAKLSELPAELIHRIIDQVIQSSEHQCLHHHHHHHLDHHHMDHNELELQSVHSTTTPQQEDNSNSNSQREPSQQNTSNNTRRTEQQQEHNHLHIHNHGDDDEGRRNSAANTPNNFPPFNITDFSVSFTAGPAGDFGLSTRTSAHNHLIDPDENEHDPQASWPDGLPSDSLVTFSLVNRTFQQCAQERLYKHVSLYSPWQANLFLRTLNRNKSDCSPFLQDQPNSSSASIDIKGKRRAQFDDHQDNSPRIYRRLNRLGDHVRSLRFVWMGPASMGKGGGSLICEILHNCPQLESFAISTALLSHCKEPLFRALEHHSLIKEFMLLKNPVDNPRIFLWKADEVLSRLFTKWDSLETIDTIGLSGRPLDRMENVLRSIPTFTCALKVIALARPNLAEIEISKILNTSKATMHTLRITYPSLKLDRKGLYRLLTDYTNPGLQSLTIRVGKDWHPINHGRGTAATLAEASSDPSINPHLCDLIFKSSAMRNLKSLSIGGPLASSKLFPLLPETIVKLAWEDCPAIQPGSFAKFLTSWPTQQTDPLGNLDSNCTTGEQAGRNLPDLKCCSVGTDDFNWKRADRRAVENALKDRKACFHSSNCQAFFPPAWFRPPSESEDEETQSNGDGWDEEMNDDPDWQTEDEEEDDDDDEHDDDDDEDEDDDEDDDDDGGAGGGANGTRNHRAPGFMPPPPMMFPGLFGMPMPTFSYPLPAGPGVEGSATAWMFGGASMRSRAGPGAGPTSTGRPPANPSGSAHPSRTHSSRSTTNPSTRRVPATAAQPRNSHRTTTPQAPAARSNQAGPSSSTTTPTAAPAAGSSASSSTRRPRSPGLFGPDFKFGKMFD